MGPVIVKILLLRRLVRVPGSVSRVPLVFLFLPMVTCSIS